ncbi:hypothetical protein [Hymenobacter sp. B81]|uniref:hypothetical protein n=1 Tax=Hymenobacter sp. B81 TaxID=3344878 RepID=UPI0037DC2CD4
MNALDAQYQHAIDELAHDLLAERAAELRNWPDYGNCTIQVNNRVQDVGWWHYSFQETGQHHIFFKTGRKLWFGFYRPYLSGVKIAADNTVSLLSDEEVAEYD